ncbi:MULTISPECIES: aspartate/glutamate racemase family protein [Rodentibacter]|uniref:Aspartate racemase n=2 Tax=Rodentibacter TaxID=1960084 RepID=A0A1V3JFM5_9PAST|nr:MULTISPECIES: amino acid racemase [Rodentibacter]OOF38018.1 aspartate racemase [Rodentibacter mrazii]OOF55092.1 aspartate racemase [Rodentibacter genomosp. 2]
MKNVIGILGGMGPAATVDMFQKFIQFTPATCDQEHIPLIISSIPDIPDRTSSILHGGASPLMAMDERIQGLERAGAKCILIACNTAHYWYDELKDRCHVDMLNIVDSTINEIIKTGKTKIGILATDATLAIHLYQTKLENQGLTCLIPEGSNQKSVMESIYLYKSGEIDKAEKLMLVQRDELIRRGAEVIILGCTEVPLILHRVIKDEPTLYEDSTAALVRAAIRWYHTH